MAGATTHNTRKKGERLAYEARRSPIKHRDWLSAVAVSPRRLGFRFYIVGRGRMSRPAILPHLALETAGAITGVLVAPV